MSDYVFKPKGTVYIADGKPFPGKVTILYTPPGGFMAKTMELPERAFLEACSDLADRKAAKANGVHKREAKPDAPKPVRSLTRPVAV